MITDILVILSLIISVFPLYILVQFKNERILKLFATISPAHIEEMMNPIRTLLTTAYRQQKIKTNTNNFLHLNLKKKKNIS